VELGIRAVDVVEVLVSAIARPSLKARICERPTDAGLVSKSISARISITNSRSPLPTFS
jgi:hypothetical protein